MAAPPPPPQGGPSVDHKREPCPDRILDDVGGAFGMGAVGGGIWHALKGAKNSPGGARLRGSFEVQRARVGKDGARCWRVGMFFAASNRRPAPRFFFRRLLLPFKLFLRVRSLSLFHSILVPASRCFSLEPRSSEENAKEKKRKPGGFKQKIIFGQLTTTTLGVAARHSLYSSTLPPPPPKKKEKKTRTHLLTSLTGKKTPPRTSSGDPPRGPSRRRLLRGLGRTVLLVRLHACRGAPEGGPVELHRGRRPHRRLLAAAHGARVGCEVGGVWRRAPRDDRRAGHFADEDDRAAAGAADARRRSAADLLCFGGPFSRRRREPGARAEHDARGAAASLGRRRSGGEQQRKWKRRRRLFWRLVWWRRQRGFSVDRSLIGNHSGRRPDLRPFCSAADACGFAGRGLRGERGRQQQQQRRWRRGVVQVKMNCSSSCFRFLCYEYPALKRAPRFSSLKRVSIETL